MLTSKKWLSQYLDLSDITPEVLADKLTTAGNEVEGLEKMAQGSNLIIGKVLECSDHPDSDHLHVCKVDLGDKVDTIVCGAPNVAAGQKVIVALPGAKLPGGEIKNGVIRGVESNGMICSLLELGVDAKQLSEESKNGIEVLGDDAVVGDRDPLHYLGLDDTLLDVGLTPNRNDCLASWALAKEVGAILHREVQLPECEGAANIGVPTKLKVSSETSKCPIFLGKVIGSVTIKPSPKWMQELLHAAGVKSINNVVDISNFVMLETGQPTHFYDAAKMHQEIIVKDGFDTTYTALDGVDYKIEPEDIMITTQGNPVGIAGIMGGDDSKIDEQTKGIIIEVATFNYVQVRNTARRLNITSDAAVRNAKEIEPMAVYKAMDRCVQLLIEYADASLIEETAQYGTNNYVPAEFTVNTDSINHLLGTDFSEDEIMTELKWLDLKPEKAGNDIKVSIPSYRTDLKIEADIAEEVIRLIGYDRLPSTLPTMSMTVGALDNRQAMRRRIRSMYVNMGLNETETYTLVSQKHLDHAILPITPAVELASPMSEDRKYIRSSILPSMLDAAAYNNNRSIKDLAFFEISNVYAKDVVEERLALVMNGLMHKSRWQKMSVPADFYTIKGLIETMLSQLGYEGSRVSIKENKLDTTHFHPYRSACIYIGKELFGIFGQIHPQMAKDFDVPKELVMFEGKLDVLLNNKTSKVKYTPISKYPAVTRDLAFVVKEDVKVADIVEAIRKCGRQIIKGIEVFDVYTGEHVEKGFKSIALSINFQSDEKTLTDGEINSVHEKILAALKAELDAILRG